VEAVPLTWAGPVFTADSATRPTGYAVARAFGAGPLEVRTEARLSGGTTPFVAAHDPDVEPPAIIQYTDSGVAEHFPGEAPTAVYSIAATDWYGRWSDWISADHSRVRVAPQVPAVRRVTLSVAGGPTPHAAEAVVEFSWDWSHRRPQQITLRLLVHAEGTPPPAVDGSVLEVGGATKPDTVLDFSSATPDTPPAGVTVVTEETNGNLRTYRTTISELTFDFDSHPLVRVTARARATERVGFGQPSALSPDAVTLAASPIPPPPPFVPAEMWWASVPDPRGTSRTTLSWAPSAPRYAVYAAEETALCRELGLPSPDLEVPAADRLVHLRPQPFAQARAAFRRVADNLTTPEVAVELPRGSKMIHFYGVLPISETGVEGALPAGGNDYFAVAAPTVQAPEMPKLAAREIGAGVRLLVEVPETRVRVDRIEIFRAPSRNRAVQLEHAGPPVLVASAGTGTREGGVIRFELNDLAPGPPWREVFYRAVAWGETDLSRGLYGGRSVPTRAVGAVVRTAAPPSLLDLRVEAVPGVVGHQLVSFLSDAPLLLTSLGAHAFGITVVMPDATVSTRRVRADLLPLLDGPLPGPAEQADTIFRHDAVEPRAGRTYAWVPDGAGAVIVEVTDPAGRSARETRNVS
jgi:hypothetical protein